MKIIKSVKKFLTEKPSPESYLIMAATGIILGIVATQFLEKM